jgi:hypothetical protein
MFQECYRCKTFTVVFRHLTQICNLQNCIQIQSRKCDFIPYTESRISSYVLASKTWQFNKPLQKNNFDKEMLSC